MSTYRYCAVEAGSLAGSSGLHSISGLCRVTQLAWSPSGLHLTYLYTAVLGAPGDRKKSNFIVRFSCGILCNTSSVKTLLWQHRVAHLDQIGETIRVY